MNDGPAPITTFSQATTVGYSWQAIWDTSRLDHENQYEIRVRAYDGEDYSEDDVKRITISKPADENNIPPQFNATIESQITIFCVTVQFREPMWWWWSYRFESILQ